MTAVGIMQTEAGKDKGFYQGDASNSTLLEICLRVAPHQCIYQSYYLVQHSMNELWFSSYFNRDLTKSFYNSGVYGSVVP